MSSVWNTMEKILVSKILIFIYFYCQNQEGTIATAIMTLHTWFKKNFKIAFKIITSRKKELNFRFFLSSAPSKLALGVEDRRIPDGSFSASSIWSRNFAPKQARLNIAKRGRLYGAWAARRNNRAQWLLVDITKLARVVGFATQGRHDYNQWVMSLRISYSRDGIRFQYYSERRRPKVRYQHGGVRVGRGNNPWSSRASSLLLASIFCLKLAQDLISINLLYWLAKLSCVSRQKFGEWNVCLYLYMHQQFFPLKTNRVVVFRRSDSPCRCALLKLFVVFLYELCLVTVLVGTRNTY